MTDWGVAEKNGQGGKDKRRKWYKNRGMRYKVEGSKDDRYAQYIPLKNHAINIKVLDGINISFVLQSIVHI